MLSRGRRPSAAVVEADFAALRQEKVPGIIDWFIDWLIGYVLNDWFFSKYDFGGSNLESYSVALQQERVPGIIDRLIDH